MDERTKLIDWAARNHETTWAALQWLYDEAVAAERERIASAWDNCVADIEAHGLVDVGASIRAGRLVDWA